MHLSNSIDCVFQGQLWYNSPISCYQPHSVKSRNHCDSAPGTLTHKQETFIPPWDFHSASVLDPLRLCYLSSRARESKMSTSPGWKLNQSRPKSSQNWEIYTWKEPSNLSSSPKLESSPQGLNLSFTLPSLRRHFPVSVWWSSGDQEHTPSLGK